MKDDFDKMDSVFRKAGTSAEQSVSAWRQPDPNMLRHERQSDWDKDPRVVNGVEYFTIGALAAALGRKQNTLRSWEDKGHIPKARYRTPPPTIGHLPGRKAAGIRLYTRRQIEIILEAAEATGVLNVDNAAVANWKSFAKMVRSSWASV